MKAVVIHKHGGPEALSYEEIADPVPGPLEVLIRVEATALNHVDIDVRNGTSGVEATGQQPLPHVPGVDAVGTVQAVGGEVTRWRVGDRVAPHFIVSCGACAPCRGGRENVCANSRILGLTRWGGYAELICVPERACVAVPDGVSAADAAAGMTPFATAWEGLVDTARLRPGETVLITGAGGGVACHAVQVAALAGARVVACAGDDAKLERVRSLVGGEGVLAGVVNYRTENLVDGVMRVTGGKGVDVVFDGIGGQILKDSINCLSDGGRIASIGAHGGEKVEIDMIQFFRKHITMHGCGRSTREIVEKVLGLMATGRLKPVVHGTWKLADVREAMAVMEGRAFFGRIVLTP